MRRVYYLFLPFLFLPILVQSTEESPEQDVLFDLDNRTRNSFSASEIQDGIYLAIDDDRNSLPYETVRTIGRLIGNITESSDITLIPASTTWRYFRMSLRGHFDEIQTDSSSIELSYLYTDSTGLMPTSMARFRRGNERTNAGTSDIVRDFFIWEHPLRLILRKTGNGTFDFPPPYVDISEISGLANDSYGQLTGDCSLDRAYQQLSLGQFTTAKREDCMGVVGSLGDDTRCYLNDLNCRTDCEDQCCETERHEYNRNATCMLIQIYPSHVTADKTFLDLLEGWNKWSLDAPMGTGREFQKILVVVKAGESNLNVDVGEETIRQRQRSSEVVEALLTRIVNNAENSIPLRPSAVELALVCATVLSAMMTVDSGNIYLGFSRTMRMMKKKGWSPVWKSAFSIPLVVLISILPALTPVAIIIYQEISVGKLNMTRLGSTWHARLVSDRPDGEDLFWIRRVLTEARITSGRSVRVAYILLPLALLVADLILESYWLLRSRRGIDKENEISAIEEEDVSEVFYSIRGDGSAAQLGTKKAMHR